MPYRTIKRWDLLVWYWTLPDGFLITYTAASGLHFLLTIFYEELLLIVYIHFLYLSDLLYSLCVRKYNVKRRCSFWTNYFHEYLILNLLLCKTNLCAWLCLLCNFIKNFKIICGYIWSWYTEILVIGVFSAF